MTSPTRAATLLAQIILEFRLMGEYDDADADALCKAAAVLRGDPDRHKVAPGLETVVNNLDHQTLVDELSALVPGKPVGSDCEFHYFVPQSLFDRVVEALCQTDPGLIARLKSRLEWDEAWEEAADGIAKRDATLARMRAALDRLGSMEAFEMSRIADWTLPEVRELLARVEFAREAARAC